MTEKKYIIDNPTLMAEWNFEKNAQFDFSPHILTLGSGKKVWWKCKKGHEWESSIVSKTKGHGCPYCSGRYAIKGENDLQTVNPKLANEWNYSKNNELRPIDVLPNSSKRVWWECSKGHEWQATISSRNRGSGCPICNSEYHTSYPEYSIIYYIKQCGFEVLHSYKGYGYELDIYIPSKKIAIEYDGYYWHKNKREKDLEKNRKCKRDGIKLYRVREGLFPLNDTSIDYIVQKNQKNLCEIIQKILYKITGINIDIDLKRDTIAIENTREYIEKENSLLYTKPEIVQEWNYTRNVKLKPLHFTANSGKMVWWICDKGHEWRASIDNRSKHGCPYCSGRYPIKGQTDLGSINPNLSNEWNYEKNGTLKPENFTVSSGKKVWWICNKGHEWQAIIANRNKGLNCPYCSNQKILEGYNDLATCNPVLAKEWDESRNGCLKPKHFTANSGKKVWWICDKGHEWQATIHSRNRGCGCPYCSGRYSIKGQTDLGTVNPNLSNEWNYERNGTLKPENFTVSSGKKVWWICNKGHEWQAVISNRSKGVGCPYCANYKALQGYNDLTTLNPNLAKEWHYARNEDLLPTYISANSHKKVWWICNKGHEWYASVDSRNRGNCCPYCSNKKALQGYNDLVSVNPRLAREWNYTKNGDLRPEHFTVGSDKKVWWICKNNHEWQANIYHRNHGTGCPYCSGKKKL